MKLDLWGIRYMSHCVSYFSYSFSLWNVCIILVYYIHTGYLSHFIAPLEKNNDKCNVEL